MANKTRSKTAENASAVYKTSRKWETNRKRKLEKQLKLQPNNEQVKLALKNIHYRRKTPVKQEWSASWIRVAKIFKEFTGSFNRLIMSNNPKVAAEALQMPGKNVNWQAPKSYTTKSFFSIAVRAAGV